MVLAGPNGAGKSSSAAAVLRDVVGVTVFVNADEIVRGLAGFDPDAMAIQAGRVMLDQPGALIAARTDFAFETTLAGLGTLRLLRRALDVGYRVHLVYFWLPSAEMAVARVRQRVRAGGHDVPTEVIRRRFGRSVANFDRVYRRLASTWRVYDGGAPGPVPLVARGAAGAEPVVIDAGRWGALQSQVAAFGSPPGDSDE